MKIKAGFVERGCAGGMMLAAFDRFFFSLGIENSPPNTYRTIHQGFISIAPRMPGFQQIKKEAPGN
jgi:hypothetical protein